MYTIDEFSFDVDASSCHAWHRVRAVGVSEVGYDDGDLGCGVVGYGAGDVGVIVVGSLPNGPSGFRVYEKEAPATVTLNKNEGVGGLSIEMSIAMKMQVLACAAEQQ